MITFFTPQPFAPGSDVALDDDAAAHARARRIAAGEPARLLDGLGSIGRGIVTAVQKRDVLVRVESVERQPRPTPLEVLVPVADKDRMLWAAEKCAELRVTAWRPTHYSRSRSVSPRGEGERFREKVAARMRAALEQSGGAWLPTITPEVEFHEALDQVDERFLRLLLDSGGTSMQAPKPLPGIALAVGPEGGLEASEIDAARKLGWVPISLGASTLRFETAIIAAVAIVRSVHQPGD